MSLAELQSSFSRAVTGSHGVRSEDLDAEQALAVEGILRDPGLDVVKMLYRSWRLTKVVSLLPLTTSAMPEERVAELLADFWSKRAAVGPYFVEECLAFLDFMTEQRAISDARVQDLATFERARLELHDELAQGASAAECEVVLTYRPRDLFARGSDLPLDEPVEPSTVRGSVSPQGDERWRVVGGPDAGLELAVAPPAH